MLFLAGECTLHEAVDVLQADADRTGLVDMIGQDAVQLFMAAALEAVPRTIKRPSQTRIASAAELQADHEASPLPRRELSGPAASTIVAGRAPKALNPHPTKLRLRAFWREVMAARYTGRPAELAAALMQVACESGLITEVQRLCHHREEDVCHIIKWGLLGWNPWGKEFPDGI
jgi:hypothetical protein